MSDKSLASRSFLVEANTGLFQLATCLDPD